MPQLPIHPNCRCKLVKLEVEETENVKSNILQMIDELNYYENQEFIIYSNRISHTVQLMHTGVAQR